MSDVIWDVVPDLAESSAMAQFARQAGIDPFDYDHLHRWSISDLEGFWSKLWDFAGIIGEKGDQAFRADPADRMMGSEFFPDARLNLAENLLRRTGDESVLVGRDEAGGREELSADQVPGDFSGNLADPIRNIVIAPAIAIARLGKDQFRPHLPDPVDNRHHRRSEGHRASHRRGAVEPTERAYPA
ncbi:MAG: acetyl-coenzyme A synthetase N-terminal domain-containing protein [Maritimibacter sp.]